MTKSDIKMQELTEQLELAGISYEQHDHPIKKEIAQMKDVPPLTLELVSSIHVLVDGISIIYGEVAFNNYELMGSEFDCDRFATADEVVTALLDRKK